MAGGLTISTLNDSSGVLATQNGMRGIAKAWVLFNGSSGAITNSFNVSSVTVNGIGVYRVSFTTAMPNANYIFVASDRFALQSNWGTLNAFGTPTTTYIDCTSKYGGTYYYAENANIAILGN